MALEFLLTKLSYVSVVIVHRAVFFFAMLFDINIESLLFCLDRHYVEMCSSGWLSKFKVVFYMSSRLF